MGGGCSHITSFRAASILNSRPILDVYFNMLLLGHANLNVPPKDYKDYDSPLARPAFVSEMKAFFLNQFKVQDFHTLVPTNKCQVPQRNISDRDLVLIMYSSKSKSGEYRLGRVVAVEVDKDKLVKTVLVRYST